jgi:transposase
MAPRFQNMDRNTPLLLPPDLRDWVAQDDLVHFIISAVERLPLSPFAVNQKGCGDAQYPPHAMLALLICCYAHGLFSSRRIERATHRDVAVRYLMANHHPGHASICAFRRHHLEAIARAFVDVLELARELKLLQLGTVGLDGVHIKASAAKDQNVPYERAQPRRTPRRLDVDQLLAQAQQAGAQEEDPQKLPQENSPPGKAPGQNGGGLRATGSARPGSCGAGKGRGGSQAGGARKSAKALQAARPWNPVPLPRPRSGST